MLRSLIVPVLLICCPPLSQSQLVKFVELQTVFTMPTLCLTLRFWSHPQMLIRHDSVVLSDAWPCVLCEHTQKHSFSLSLSLSLPFQIFINLLYIFIFLCVHLSPSIPFQFPIYQYMTLNWVWCITTTFYCITFVHAYYYIIPLLIINNISLGVLAKASQN